MGFALAATPATAIIGLVIIGLIEALGYAIHTVQSAGHWWMILIVAYVLSLIYFLCEPTIRRNRERKKMVNGLILYWKDQLRKQDDPYYPLETEIEVVRGMFLERFGVWAWFDTKIWIRHFPDEKYSKYLFGIVDNFMEYYKNKTVKDLVRDEIRDREYRS